MSLCLINATQPPTPYPLLKKYKAPPILFKSTLKILGTCGKTTRKVETCWLPPSWMIFCRWSAMRLRNALLKGKPSRCGNTSAVSTTVSWTSYKENYSTNSKHFNKINQSPQTKKWGSILNLVVYSIESSICLVTHSLMRDACSNAVIKTPEWLLWLHCLVFFWQTLWIRETLAITNFKYHISVRIQTEIDISKFNQKKFLTSFFVQFPLF